MQYYHPLGHENVPPMVVMSLFNYLLAVSYLINYGNCCNNGMLE